MSCPNCEKLERELLSALAAIEKLKPQLSRWHRNVEHGDYLKCVLCGSEWKEREQHEPNCPLNLDFLSLLHQHDAEVRKPLVEALEQIKQGSCSNRGRCMDCDSIASLAIDALAKEEKK